MQRPHHIIFFLLLFFVLLIPRWGSTEPQPEELPLQGSHQGDTTGAVTSEAQQPASYNDFSNFNLSTPQRASVSFIELYNGIVPATKTNDLEEICTKSATISYQRDCIALLENRLNFLRSIAKTLKGAYFSYQPLTQLNEIPMQLQASWKEKLSFFDDTTKLNNKSMTITLQKSDNEWKVLTVTE